MNKKSRLFVFLAMFFAAFICGAMVSAVINAQSDPAVSLPNFYYPKFSFQNNLKLGDNSQDVRQLQLVLNSDKDTVISSSGIGSNGQETTYFGQLTMVAVIRFQKKYNINTTGFVGPLTRSKLNQIISSAVSGPVSVSANGSVISSSTVASTTLVSGAQPLTAELLPRLYSVQPQQIKKDGTITLIGVGFQTQNTIHIGSNVFSNVLPEDGSNISFTIPATSTISNGTYKIWVENSKGTSQILDQDINLVIADTPQQAPVISSVLPASVTGTQVVTVTGTGFDGTNNSIISGFGTLNNVGSTGTQITFSPKSLLSPDVIARIPAGMSIKIDFYVVNQNGASNVAGSVNFKL